MYSSGERSLLPWLVAAFVLYLSTVVITVVIHLPLNDAIRARRNSGSDT